jgi:amino acid transporter/nucleotide-binding universal stress UspA family protein
VPAPRQLTWVLAWAVVFCDIGTSVYYVPGILYGHVGNLAPLFVVLTTAGFVLLSSKYAEIAWRNPEGGGVVTITTKALGPRWGCLGGMLITVDYFLTSAISAVSGLHYLASVFPFFEGRIEAMACAALLGLATVNIIGIRESATLALGMAVAALAANLLVVVLAVAHWQPHHFTALMQAIQHSQHLSWRTLMVGFAGAWLAFSGLESISQLSAAMNTPLRKTSARAMLAVVITIILTAPVLTTMAIIVLPDGVKTEQSERFISELGGSLGGLPVKLAVVATASTLLLFAANTAIIGCYHVFLALANRGFLPSVLLKRNRQFGTPHIAIAVSTLVPLAVIVATEGEMSLLGDMYAFGLLGAFTLSSLSLDVIRWQRRRRGLSFWLGILTTAVVMLAWGVNLLEKQLATAFGGAVTGLGMILGVGLQQGWFTNALYRIPAIRAKAARVVRAAEATTADIQNLISLSEAVELRSLFPTCTLIAIRGENPALVREAAARVRGRSGHFLYCLYVEEWPGLFSGSSAVRPDEEGIETLTKAIATARECGVDPIPIWTISQSAPEAIAQAATALGVDAVMVGVSHRSAIYHLLRGHVVKGLAARLPRTCRLILCN